MSRVKFTAGGKKYRVDSSELDQAKQQFPDLQLLPPESLPRRAGEYLATSKALPVAGQIAGGLVGGIPGAALGGAAGEGYKQIAGFLTGQPLQSDVPQMFKEAQMGAIQEVGGKALGLAAKPLAPIARAFKEQIIPAALSTGSGMAKTVAQRLINAPKNLIKSVPGGEEALATAIENLKVGLENQRGRLGQAVESAANNLNEAVKGQKVVNMSEWANSVLDRAKKLRVDVPTEVKGLLKNFLPQKNPNYYPGLGANQAAFDVLASPLEAQSAKLELNKILSQEIQDQSGQIVKKFNRKSNTYRWINSASSELSSKLSNAEQKLLGSQNYAAANKEASNFYKTYDILQDKLLRGTPEKRVAAMTGEKGQVTLRGIKKIEQKFQPGVPSNAERLANIYASQQGQPLLNTLPRTGLTGLGIAGLTQLNPAALALAPFVSPRFGTAYGRFLAGAGTAGANLATRLAPTAGRLGVQGSRLFQNGK